MPQNKCSAERKPRVRGNDSARPLLGAEERVIGHRPGPGMTPTRGLRTALHLRTHGVGRGVRHVARGYHAPPFPSRGYQVALAVRLPSRARQPGPSSRGAHRTVQDTGHTRDQNPKPKTQKSIMLESGARESDLFRANFSYLERDFAVHVGLETCPGGRCLCPFTVEPGSH
jgi:hypothetical protein